MVLLLATIVTITFAGGKDASHPIIDSWVIVEDDNIFTIKFNLNGSFVSYDSGSDSMDGFGVWSIDDGSETGGYIEIRSGGQVGEYYYHISKNMLVIHSVTDGGTGCDAFVREGYADTSDMRQTEVAIASPPDFCTLRSVE